MPLYDFVCEECGHCFELLLMGAEKPRCPECGGGKVKKQVSRFAVGGTGGGRSCSGCGGGDCSSCG